MSGWVIAVNVVHAVLPDPFGDVGTTAIDKRPRGGRLRVTRHGVEGDHVEDVAHHGGRDKAVYAYAAEDAAWWSAALGREVTAGLFGENLTLRGVDVTGAVIGERWRVGDDGCVLEVAEPRIPCRTFQHRMGEPQWVRRFTEHGAPGAYCRVVSEGSVAAGDPVEVIDRPAHGVTIGQAFRPRGVDESRLERLLAAGDVPVALAAAVRRDLAARRRVAR